MRGAALTAAGIRPPCSCRAPPTHPRTLPHTATAHARHQVLCYEDSRLLKSFSDIVKLMYNAGARGCRCRPLVTLLLLLWLWGCRLACKRGSASRH